MKQTLNANSQYLIALLQSVLRGSPPPAMPKEVELGGLYSLAEAHSVSNMAYHALYRLDIPQSELTLFEKSHRAYMTRSVMQEIEFRRITDAFEAAGIAYVPLKGWFTRTLYPDSFMRSMGDIDILVRENDCFRIYPIMSKLGYSCKDFMKHDDDSFRKNGVLVEIHRSLDSDGLSDKHYYDDPWGRVTPVLGCRYELGIDDGYLYSIAHAKKHFMNMGTGIRSVIDTYVYLNKLGTKLNRMYIEREAAVMGIASFMHCMEKVADQLFGDAPIDDDTVELTQFILDCGSAGTQSNLDAANLNRSGHGGKNGSKLSYGFRLVFPTYAAMKKRNPVLKKSPMLLPAVYVWRWLQLIFTKQYRITEAVARYDAIDSSHAERVRRIHRLAGID